MLRSDFASPSSPNKPFCPYCDWRAAHTLQTNQIHVPTIVRTLCLSLDAEPFQIFLLMRIFLLEILHMAPMLELGSPMILYFVGLDRGRPPGVAFATGKLYTDRAWPR
jgi:Zn-dependent protease